MKATIKKVLKKTLPPWLLIVRRNCGGINRNTKLFAANLLDKSLTDKQFKCIADALIFSNGVRKTTYSGRNYKWLEKLFDTHGYRATSPLKILDIGASYGTDSITNLEIILKHAPVDKYVVADLYTELLYDPEKEMVFDQDGNPIQIKTEDGFVSFNFEFKYGIEKLYHIFNIHKTTQIKKKYNHLKPNPDKVIRIPMLNKYLEENHYLKGLRQNVFDPIPEQFDVIICINLLQPRYFSSKLIKEGNENLKKSLSERGVLISGVTDDVNYYFRH